MSKSYLKDIYDSALFEGIDKNDIEKMTLHGRCSLISDIVDALRDKIPQKKLGNAKIARSSLTVIVNSFEPSEGFLKYQDHKREQFLRTMSFPENEELLDRISSWSNISESERQETIIKSSSLHQYTYLSGAADRVSINWLFMDQPVFKDRRNVMLVGGFYGNLSGEFGTIRVAVDNIFNVEDVLNNVHHETTHAVQFALASAYHRNRINPSHILYDDARMFHAIEVKMAVVPCSVLKHTEQEAYRQQVHEILADNEGRDISAALMELAQ